MMNKRISVRQLLMAMLAMALSISPVYAERVKDIATVAGVRSNQLVGYGLVLGLNGTGDQTSQTPFTVQSIKSMLTQFGITLPPGTNMQLKNVAAVVVHADLPPFAKPGQTIDITVSTIGNAKSLRGGSLLMTPLKGADGQVYAMAQGSVITSGFGAAGKDGSSITVNVPSAGRIPNGATVERLVPMRIGGDSTLIFNLHTADFTTANRLAESINETMGEGTASAIDAGSIVVNAPRDQKQRISYLAMLENLTVNPGQAAARVIINSRTGTVVIGQNVRVMPAAISHGSLTVTITESIEVSQPDRFFSGGRTVAAPASDVTVEQKGDRMFLFSPGVELNEIVRAVNEVGAAPGDLVAILEALKQAGALRAELIVI
jgi:flagellar P-ring protein precursor FlgI